MTLLKHFTSFNKLVAGAILLGLCNQSYALSVGGLLGFSAKYDEGKPGTFLEQIAEKNRFPKQPYQPDAKLFSLYDNAKLDKPIALALHENQYLVEAPLLQQHCQKIVDRLLASWDGPKPDHIPVLIRDNDKYGAIALNSGVIMVNAGTFSTKDGAHYDDELALMLGHELSHLLLHHFKRSKYMDKLVQGIKLATTTTLAYASVKHSSFDGEKLDVKGDGDQALSHFKSGLALNVFAADIADPIWKRGQETNADYMGIDLAQKAGFHMDTGIIKKFIKKHSEEHEHKSREHEALRMLMRQQIKDAAKTIVINQSSKHTPAGLNTGAVGDLLNKAKSTVTDKSIDAIFDAIAKINKNHPSREERVEMLRTYVKAHYPSKPFKHDRKSIESVEYNQSVVKLIQKLNKMYEFPEELFINAEQKSPKQLVDQVVELGKKQKATIAKSKTSNKQLKPKQVEKLPKVTNFVAPEAPHTLYVSGVLHKKSNSPKKAIQHLEIGAQSKFATINHIQELGRLYFEHKQPKKLAKLIDQTQSKMGTNQPIMDLVVANAVLSEDITQAEVSAAKCLDFDKGVMYPLCALYLGYDPTNKDVDAQTEAGKKAFAGKGILKSLQNTLTFLD